jgi:predicted nucleotidyltransferase
MTLSQAEDPRPTPYCDLNRVLQELASSLRALLLEDLVGVYLQGSFAVGDFDLHSDVDLAVVVQRELAQDQVEALQAMHERIHNLNSRWAKHLEGSYFPKETIRLAARRGEKLWYLDNGARSLIRSEHCNTLLVRFVVREQGLALAGPPPETLIDPITPQALRREIYRDMNEWGQEILRDPARMNNRFYQAYLVLNYCRMLHDLHRGDAGSKLAGAEWMIYSGLHREWEGLIERSWARRSNPANWVGLPADPDDFEATLAFVRYVMGLSHEFAEADA